jgi:ribulose-phosphate 3-epimerase
MEIIPAILARTKEELEQMVRKIEPHTEWAHIDIMDGAFTGNDQTILGYDEISSIGTKLRLGVHLMVVQPEQYVPQWLKTKVERIFLHVESQGRLSDLFLSIRSQGKQAGIVINPETPADAVLEFLPMVEYVQFMTVHPGSYSRPFLTDMLDKISTFHDNHPETPIAVDGGMTPETVPMVAGAGATIIVTGHYVMASDDPGKAISELRNSII